MIVLSVCRMVAVALVLIVGSLYRDSGHSYRVVVAAETEPITKLPSPLPSYEHHDFTLLFPRHGETYVSRRDTPTIKVCFYLSPSNKTKTYITESKQYTIVANFTGVNSTTHSIPFTVQSESDWTIGQPCVDYMYDQPLVHLSVEVLYIPSVGGSRVIASYNMIILVEEESGMVLAPVVMPNEFAAEAASSSQLSHLDNKLDFIEIGTSDFDTCMILSEYACDARYSHLFSCPPDVHKSFRGISVDPIRYYLESMQYLAYYSFTQNLIFDIVSFPGFRDAKHVIKLNAAVVPQTTERLVLPFYYIPSNTIRAYEMPDWLRGCIQVDGLHAGIEQQTRYFELSDAIIQKSYVKAITVSELLDSYGTQAINYARDVPSVRLFKVDAEGYDVDLINAMIDYYSNRIGLYTWQQEETGAKTVSQITDQWPCIVFFEVGMPDSYEQLESLISRLQVIGYTSYSFMALKRGSQRFTEWEVGNAAYINCQCSLYDFKVASMFLIFHEDQFQTSVVQDRCKRTGHFVK
jgi:hypothetical protein